MFTKAQIAKLSVEDQEFLARIELSKTRQRQKLLELARGLDWRSRYWPLDFLRVQEKPSLLIFFAGVMVMNGLAFHIGRVNRRLDALVELLDFDHKNQGDSNNS